MKIRLIVNIGICALLCTTAWAGAEGRTHNGCTGWKALHEKGLETGLSTNQVEHALRACQRRGLGTEEADALLCPVYDAQADGLPADCILSKVEEGLAKRVEAESVAAAAEARLQHLRTARKLIESQPRGRRHMGGPPRLLSHTCLALESGLPEDVLQAVFEHNGGKRMGRLVHVIEAGESLQLAGFDPKDTRQIMFDCMERNLTPPQIHRIVEHVIVEHEKGHSFPELHGRLWGKQD